MPVSAVAANVVKLHRAGSELKALCPFHAERTPSFTIFADDTKFQCFGCGARGDVLDFVRRAYGVSLTGAIALLDGDRLPLFQRTSAPAAPKEDRADEARQIWQRAVPITGTEAQVYLNGRGLHLAPSALRFARLRYGSGGYAHPVLIALVTGLDGRPIGIQRTFLAKGGQGKLNVPKPRLSLGRVKGGAIRLSPPAAEVIITEGLEDALSILQESEQPAWAAAGAGMLGSVRFPASVKSVVIGADNDAAGRRAAQEAGEGYARSGMTAKILRPLPQFKDFNAMLLAFLEGQCA